MSTSPLRNLVARRVCECRSIQSIHKIPSKSFIFTTTRSNTSYSAPSSYGSAEQLKRKYRYNPDTKHGASSAERIKVLRRMRRSAYGIGLCTLAVFGTIYLYPDPSKQQGNKNSSSGSVSLDTSPTLASLPSSSSAEEEIEQIPTGTTKIPTFPKIIHLTSEAPSSSPASVNEGTEKVEYQLVGLGVRTVSFLNIQVYVVGLYIAVPDIATLQEKLIRTVDPVATTLVPGERSKLKEMLLDGEKGEEIWNKILVDGGIRTAFRIVPTRNTDFMHMRDGFVRGITARSTHFSSNKSDKSFSDETFGSSLNEFKSVFGGTARKKIPAGETLLLTRDPKGKFSAWYEDKTKDIIKMGDITDERIGRLLWLNYLAGKSVSSEPARQNIVDGMMEYLERPVGTVAMQVI